MNKKTIIAIVAVVLAVAALVGVYFLTRPKTDDAEKAFTVIVEHKDGSEKPFALKSTRGMLADALEDEGIVSGEKSVETGLYIKVADGERADYVEDGGYWAVWIGEEKSIAGVSSIPIEDGKVYRIVWTPADQF